jgi:hypothetical protein
MGSPHFFSSELDGGAFTCGRMIGLDVWPAASVVTVTLAYAAEEHGAGAALLPGSFGLTRATLKVMMHPCDDNDIPCEQCKDSSGSSSTLHVG